MASSGKDAGADRRHQERRIVAKWLDCGVNGVGFDERLVALDVDDEVAVEAGSHFGEPIGAREVVGARHPHGSPEFCNRVRDSPIVGRDNHGVNIARRRCAAVHVLDHRPASDIGKRLARKAGRRVAGRDDSDSMFMILKGIADAF